MNNVQPGVKGFVAVDIKARFFAKVDKVTRFGPNSDCWRWIGASDSRGYGQLWRDGRKARAHQVSWEIENQQPFPKGMDGCHSCDIPACVNPHHIFPGTASDNAKDSVRKGRTVLPVSRGTENGWAKLNDDAVRRIRALAASGTTRRKIAREMGVNIDTIWRVLSGRSWQHVDAALSAPAAPEVPKP